jgi:hypothetical protein
MMMWQSVFNPAATDSFVVSDRKSARSLGKSLNKNISLLLLKAALIHGELRSVLSLPFHEYPASA